MADKKSQNPPGARAGSEGRRRTGGRVIGLTLVGATLLAVLAAAWHWNRPEMLAARWQARLAELPDAEIEAELRRIAALGDAGVPVLARALGSPREVLQAAARNALLDELVRWELLPSARAKTKLAILAETLSSAASSFDPPTRRFAADLAMRILHWPHEDGDTDRAALLAHCEAVFAAAADRRGAGLPEPPQVSSGSAINGDPSDTLANVPHLPGGRLPIEVANLPSHPQTNSQHDNEAANTATVEPSKLPTTTGAKSLDRSGRTESAGSTHGAPFANQARRLANADDHDQAARTAHTQTGDATEGSDLAAARLREVVEKLDAADSQDAAAARAELERRGITGPLVEIARRLADRDPAVRLKLTESLPTLPGVDARAWLLELSYDDDAQVRSAAVTLMATSGDIDLLKRVQQVALEDPDDHTRAQAEKALPRAKRR